MTEQHIEDPDAVRIPRPAETPEALRRAVARINPSRIKEFDRQLLAASTEAQELRGIGPMRVFCRSWAQHIEIHRFPAIGRRLEELERIVAFARPDSDSATKEKADSAISEISRIARDANARLDG